MLTSLQNPEEAAGTCTFLSNMFNTVFEASRIVRTKATFSCDRGRWTDED